MTEPAAKASAGARLWRWLRHGRMAGGQGWAIYLAAGTPRWWAVPRRIWLALARRRRIIPSPLLYLVVAGGGLVLGVVLQFVFGIWWWLPPIALLAVAWLVFLSSIWWHPRARAASVRAALLSAINPQRAAEAHRREQRELLLACELPLFELESWPGTVRLAGYGGPPGAITHVSVGFYDEPEAPAVVSVATVADEAGHEDRMRERLISELVSRYIDQAAWPFSSPEAQRAAFAQARSQLRDLSATWTPVTIRIDGIEHQGAALRSPRGSAALVAVGNLWVTISAAGDGGDYPLRTVTDPGRIIDARS